MKSKARGALSNREGRFARREIEKDPEALAAAAAAAQDAEGAAAAAHARELLSLDDVEPAAETSVHVDSARTIIARNRSPDIPFSQSINPYRGCEHGCIYCYARPSHAYLDLSPGRDFETEIFYKPNARELLRAELAAPGYAVSPIAFGANTDPYQPVERRLQITRGLIELLLEVKHPLTIVTKSGLILRDLDLLERLAELRLVTVIVSLTTLDHELKRRMEPRTAGPEQRLNVIRALTDRGVPAGVLTAPLIPALNDHELERMLAAAAQAGARFAGYVVLRLPHEVRPLFIEWLEAHYPERAAHVLSVLSQMRGGGLNDPQFHSRQRGEGPFAGLLRARFARACRSLGLEEEPELDCTVFEKPLPLKGQLDLWGG
jgi:DNA repair photolyase